MTAKAGWPLWAALIVMVLPGCASAPGMATSAPASAHAPWFHAVLTRTAFQIRYDLQGQTQDDADVHLVSNPQLSLVPSVAINSQVAQGAVVGRMRVSPGVRAALRSGASRSSLDRGELAQLQSLQGPVVAPVSGILTTVSGEPVVRAPGIDVVIALLPIQSLRFSSSPTRCSCLRPEPRMPCC